MLPAAPARLSTMNWRPERFAHLRGDEPRRDVDAGAGREAEDDADGLGGIGLCAGGNCKAQARQSGDAAHKKPAVSFRPRPARDPETII